MRKHCYWALIFALESLGMRLHCDYEANKCPVGVSEHYERVESLHSRQRSELYI